MAYTEKEIETAVRAIIARLESAEQGGEQAGGLPVDVPLGVSNRHIHLTHADVETLFGPGYQLTPLKDLSQPGQFACKEQLTLIGPSMRAIEGVRVLGPERGATQVEISKTDAYHLKVKPPVRASGDVKGSASVVIVGPKGTITLPEGCIIANRHIHLSPDEAARYGLCDDDRVTVDVPDAPRPTRWFDVQIRVHPSFVAEMHVDTDDANSVGVGQGAKVRIVEKENR
ncbi:MAG: phosphate propanoyltransferase [Clostridia bacterium]|nr:phosphate propanoyltransferase [Clostridia bacterium]